MRIPFGLSERGISGAGIFFLTVLVIGALIVNPSLGDSDLFKTLAQAIVVQGLVGLCMAYWFTASKGEGEQATGKPGDPVHTQEEPDA